MKRANVKRQTRWLMLSLLLVTSIDVANGDQLLIDAVKGRDIGTARNLIARNVDVNAPQADGATALHWAVHRDDLELAKMLIEAGADANARNDFGVVPLSLAATNRNASMIEALLKAGADPNATLLTGETLLMTAAYTGDLDAVEVLLRHGADVNAKEPIRQQTALMWALGEKHTEVARKLIEHGADIHAATTLGFTPLLFAAREGDLEAAKMLLDAGADVNATAQHTDSNTYLASVFDAKKEEQPGLSVLHVATLTGHGDVAALLLERGADPNYDGPGYTPLHWAAGSWETELNGVNGILTPKDHEWSRMSGVQEGKKELVQALLDHGADPNARLEKNPSRYGFTVTSSRPKGSTPYVIAAMAGDADIMRLLVDNGADPSLIPSNGVPPLLWAAGVNRHRAENIATESESLEAVKVALEHGADVNMTDKSGNTAMHGAAWIRSPEIVQYLADNGGDVNVLNKYKLSPLYIAIHDGRLAGVPGPIVEHSPVADLLRELGVPEEVEKSPEEEGSPAEKESLGEEESPEE